MLDVAIIGGGPAGSTAGALLKKYAPDMQVAIFEREVFPRDHVGESQLPPISKILDEMGCWEKVEAANFPIKIGATYRWGKSKDLWDFFFIRSGQFEGTSRPGSYEGQRLQTAFQVDRSVYDDILLNHAEEMGCQVHQGVGVKQVSVDGDRVTGLTLTNGDTVEARHYMDASGNVAVLRKALGVEVDQPGALRNIAIWDYWDNAEWAETIGVGGTMVQVMSIGSGWIWFIPLSPTRTSIGYICPAHVYKDAQKSREDLYLDALAQEPLISSLTANAKREGKLAATKDWSCLSRRMAGENWFLIGETTGFADPILAAGMTLSHAGAREAAYTILELDKGNHDPAWLRDSYAQLQTMRISRHIQFADFWYAANGQFTDLQDYTAKIAADAGLKLTPKEAFQWLGTGGFIEDFQGQVGLGSYDVGSIKQVTGLFTDEVPEWELSQYNVFDLNLDGVGQRKVPNYLKGEIHAKTCLVKDTRILPLVGVTELIFAILQRHRNIGDIVGALQAFLAKRNVNATPAQAFMYAIQPLEVMVVAGWVTPNLDPTQSRLNLSTPISGEVVRVRQS